MLCDPTQRNWRLKFPLYSWAVEYRHTMNIQDVDLNLLVVFDLLFRIRSVSEAAESLGVTQPAVSRQLKRLREVFEDELFVRTSGGMEPTSYANYLSDPVSSALSTIQDAISHRLVFNPNADTRHFTIGLTDIGEIYILPTLMQILAESAPNVTIKTVRSTGKVLRDEMETGQIDLAIGQIDHLEAGFHRRTLLTQGYVCIFRKGHPLEGQRFGTQEFFGAEHVVVSVTGAGHSKVEDLISSHRRKRKVRLEVPHYVGVGHILQSSDLIATVPEAMAIPSLSPFQLTSVDHPLRLPRLDVSLFWHSRNHGDSASQWLRSTIAKRCVLPP